MTFKQILFNWILDRMGDQGYSRSYDTTINQCVYKDYDNNRACAVGCCLPNRHTPTWIDNNLDITTLASVIEYLPSYMYDRNYRLLLSSLQGWHDGDFDMAELNYIAMNHQVEITPDRMQRMVDAGLE